VIGRGQANAHRLGLETNVQRKMPCGWNYPRLGNFSQRDSFAAASQHKRRVSQNADHVKSRRVAGQILGGCRPPQPSRTYRRLPKRRR